MATAQRTNRRARPNVTIELPFEWKERLKRLVKDTHVVTRTDAVRRALSIYGALIEQQGGGWTIVLKKGTDEKPFPIN